MLSPQRFSVIQGLLYLVLVVGGLACTHHIKPTSPSASKANQPKKKEPGKPPPSQQSSIQQELASETELSPTNSDHHQQPQEEEKVKTKAKKERQVEAEAKEEKAKESTTAQMKKEPSQEIPLSEVEKTPSQQTDGESQAQQIDGKSQAQQQGWQPNSNYSPEIREAVLDSMQREEILGKEKWSERKKQVVQQVAHKYQKAQQDPQQIKRAKQSSLVGKPLPITRFIDSSGEIFDLSRFKGKKHVVLVVLRGFAGNICLFCSSQTLALMKAVSQFAEKNAQVVLVYPGRAETVPGFLDAIANLQGEETTNGFTLPFPVVLDVGLVMVDRFGIKGDLAKPTSIIVDKEGVVRFAYIGESIADRPSIPTLLQEVQEISKQN